ncbi:MAG: YXWGXW repeat-containing protein [Bacteroidia bacterium]
MIVLSSFLFGSETIYAQVSASVQIQIAPPEMPEYVQPPCPVDGYVWEPGYWAYGIEGYYWVPGVWIYPAQVGFLWTPGYWGFEGGYYGWSAGYWGENVGFYGGVCYGNGYNGEGYYGGRWEGQHFRYNTAVSNVNVTVIHNTYVDRTNINNVEVNHSSFNGVGGVARRPSANEQVAMKEKHIQPTSRQLSHQQAASKNRNELYSVNKGHPASTSTSRASKQPVHNAAIKTHQASPANGNRTKQQSPTPTQNRVQRNAVHHQATAPKHTNQQQERRQPEHHAAAPKQVNQQQERRQPQEHAAQPREQEHSREGGR